VRWQQGLPYGDLQLGAGSARDQCLPEARVDASPDVALHLQGQRIDIQGQVALPYARIEPANLTNAVLSTSDEVIVGQSSPVPEDQFKVYSNITLALGERVTVNTARSVGRLSGSITVTPTTPASAAAAASSTSRKASTWPMAATSTSSTAGCCSATASWATRGWICARSRNFPTSRPASTCAAPAQPRMTFFSDPEVAQSQIVSLLLAGGSLESVQNTTDHHRSGGNAGSRSDLMQGGAILAQQIGGRYNIEAGVEQD
jgi:translocation and assembly module TamB